MQIGTNLFVILCRDQHTRIKTRLSQHIVKSTLWAHEMLARIITSMHDRVVVVFVSTVLFPCRRGVSGDGGVPPATKSDT